MSSETSPDLLKQNAQSDDKEPPKDNAEQRTVPSLPEVQSFCAEFHVKVENAAGIRPWLQFSDTDFPGKVILQKFLSFTNKFQ